MFHESTFQSNEDQPIFWEAKGPVILKPKSKGAGTMVSDFIDKRNGYIWALTQEGYERVKVNDPT